MAEFWLPWMCRRQREPGDGNGDRISDVHPRTGDLARGHVVWTPPADARRRVALGRYPGWFAAEHGRGFVGYRDLHRWSITGLEGFWGSLWAFFAIGANAPYERVLGSDRMPGAEWFPGAWLNYAAHMVGVTRTRTRARSLPSPDALASPASIEPFAAHAARHASPSDKEREHG
jgi:hypothetical protein